MGSSLKALIAGAILTCGALGSSADAAVLVFQGGSNFTSGTFGRSGITSGDFTDILSFDMIRGYDFSSSLTSTATKLKASGKGDIDFTKVVLTALRKNGSTYTYDVLNNGSSKGLKDSADLEDEALRDGRYILSISGHSYGGGSYSGQTFATAAVPEPAAWTLMICGIGIAGGMMRRRSRVSTSKLARA